MLNINILTKEQKELLPLIRLFRKDYYLVGGTAIALQIGHRKSIDFDLFSYKHIQRRKIPTIIKNAGFVINTVIHEDIGEFHIEINQVKMTFFQFDYPIQPKINFNEIIKMPNLKDLAAMKAFALGERVKWKDYVDIYFFLKNHFTLDQVSTRAEQLFNTPESKIFSKKLFRQQLCYFQNIKFEKIDFIKTPVPDEEIKKFLIGVSTTALDQ